MHRTAVLLVIYCALVNALQIPDLQSFFAAIPLLEYSVDNATQHELLKRQNSGCPTNYNNCATLGAAGLCCAASAVCSADALGHVACCKSGVVCSGTIGGYITAGTVDSNGNLVGATAASTTVAGTTTTTGLAGVSATTTTATNTGGNGGFIIASNTVVAQPGAAARAEIPLVIQLITRVVGLLHQ